MSTTAQRGSSTDSKDASTIDRRLISLPDRDVHGPFIRDCVEIILEEAVYKGTDRDTKILDFVQPEEMKKLFDFELKEKGADDDEIKQMIRDIIKHSVKTAHPRFVNQLFSGLDPYGMVGQWLTDSLNTCPFTYEVGPMFALMEDATLRAMRVLVGYPEGKGDGLFSPGGSIANGYAMNLARFKAYPQVRKLGMGSVGRLVLFVSENAHFSMEKLAAFEGIGEDNVIKIKTDNLGRMRPDKLKAAIEAQIKEGAVPLMVLATAATTVLGAVDPLNKIADICNKFELWFHVDTAWGGGLLMSKEYRGRLSGIERSDSVTWNPQKLLCAPQQCSVFLTKHENLLAQCHSVCAPYLFQSDKFYDMSYDNGDKHLQCSRKVDVLKFWLMWKAKGRTGFEKHINKVCDTAHYFKDQIDGRPGFELLPQTFESTNVCFWFIPPSLRGKKDDPDYKEKLGAVAPKMKERMMREGSMMLGYQNMRELPNFFRMVVENSGIERSDMDDIIKIMERLGEDL